MAVTTVYSHFFTCPSCLTFEATCFNHNSTAVPIIQTVHSCTHISLTYLTDKFCATQPAAQSSLSDFLAIIDGQVTTKSKGLSSAGELDMTFNEWHQAWQWLLKLINQYYPDEFPLWHMHYSSIMLKETHAENWPLWLSYDTKVQHHSITTPLDPLNTKRGSSMTSMSTTAVIGSLHRFSLLQVLAYPHTPLHHCLTIILTSVFPTPTPLPGPVVIPFTLITLAQKQPHSAVASSVEDYHILQKTASPVPWSMANHYYSCDLLPQTPHAPIVTVGNAASDRMEKMATVCSVNMPENMPALSVATRHTMPSSAPLSSNFLIIVTPFIADS